MDTIYIGIGIVVMLVTCYLEYIFTLHTTRYLYVLPFIFAVLTFWIGLGSLLFAFALIFIGQLIPNRHQMNNSDAF